MDKRISTGSIGHNCKRHMEAYLGQECDEAMLIGPDPDN